MAARHHRVASVLVSAVLVLAGGASGATPPEPEDARTLERSARLPFFFEANLGQAHPAARFVARGGGYTVNFGRTDVLFELAKPAFSESPSGRPSVLPGPGGSDAVSLVRMSFEGARPETEVVGEEELPGKVNYLIGPESEWKTNIPAFKRVVSRGLYPGIDMACYEGQGLFKYDFVVAPGADPGAIRLAFEGVRRLSVSPEGDLVVETDAGPIEQRRPLIYQEVDGERRSVEGTYLIEGRRVRFRIGTYDPRLPLVIDPVVYGSFFGAEGTDSIHSIRVGPDGELYLLGSTSSRTGIFARAGFGTVRYLAKLDPTATVLQYLTFLDASVGGRFAVDRFGSAYLTALVPGQGIGFDAVVTKLAPDGAGVIYSWRLAGSSDDRPGSVAVDAEGNAYVVGWTRSKDLPVVGAVFQPLPGGTGFDDDGWVAKLDPGGGLVLLSYLGGGAGDTADLVALDRDRNLYVTGLTYSTAATFPPRAMANAPQPEHSDGGESSDVYIVKITPDFSNLVYLTFIGGRGEPGHFIPDDAPYGIAVDGSGGVYVGGFTLSMSLPPGRNPPFQAEHGPLTRSDYDGFLARVSPDGTAYDFVTFLGGSGADSVTGLATDSEGDVYLTGATRSPDLPVTQDAEQAGHGGPVDANGAYGNDAIFARFKPDGTAHVSLLGGSADDTGDGVGVADRVVDGQPERTVYVVGRTASSALAPPPLPRAPFQASYNGGTSDGFIVGFKFEVKAAIDILPAPDCPEESTAAALSAPVAAAGPQCLPGTTRWRPQRDPEAPAFIHFEGPADLMPLPDSTLEILDPNGAPVVGPQLALEKRGDTTPGSAEFRFTWSGPWRTPDGGYRPRGDYRVRIKGKRESGQPIESDPQDPHSVISLVEVVEVALLPATDTTPALDDNPDVANIAGQPVFVDRKGHGKRIFPDAPDPDAVRVVARTEPVLPDFHPGPRVVVHFRSFDVDDPARNAAEDVDGDKPGEVVPNDNRGLPKAGRLTLESMPVFPFSEGKVVDLFQVTRQPGDNFRVVASTSPAWLDDLRAHQPSETGELRHVNGAELTVDERSQNVSEMLTVWRRLHFEVDSMEAPPLLDATGDPERYAQRNFIAGRISAGTGRDRRPTRLWLRPEFSNPPVPMFDGSLILPIGNGRFENGTICLGATATVPRDDLIGIGCRGPIEIDGIQGNGNDFGRDYIDKPSGFVVPYTLVNSQGEGLISGNLREWNTDDHDFILDRPVSPVPIGYEGGRLTVGGVQWKVLRARGPHVRVVEDRALPFFLVDDDQAALPISLVDTDDQRRQGAGGLLKESDLSAENVLAQAYIRPVYDLPSSRVPFVRNVDDGVAIGLLARHRGFPSRTEYWTAYLVAAFQRTRIGPPGVGGDGDPDVEFSEPMVALGLSMPGLDDFSLGSLVFIEPHFEYPRVVGVPYLRAREETIAHELGHQFDLDHDEGGLMSVETTLPRYFVVSSLGRIRQAARP